MTRFIALTTTYRPLGGVVKIFDYVHHALALGLDVEVHCHDPLDHTSALFRNPGMSELLDLVTFHQGFRFGVESDDIVFFSWPTHYVEIERRVSPETDSSHIIHIVQGTRHADPRWLSGYAYQLLGTPMTRIMITDQILEATRPLVSPSSVTRLIRQGHDWNYFHQERTGGLNYPIRVAYTTWKSTIGDRVAADLRNDRRFEFRRLKDEADWKTLRDLYHWSDVFLACPRPHEGFYLPGLEAFAAGSIVVTPDVGGNLAYCTLGVNCVEVAYDKPQDYVKALSALADTDDAEIEAMRQSAYSVLPQFSLARERARFAALLAAIC